MESVSMTTAQHTLFGEQNNETLYANDRHPSFIKRKLEIAP